MRPQPDTLGGQFDRLPPHSIESEMCMLSAMLLDPTCVDDVVAAMNRDDFFQADHQILFDAILDLRAGKKIADMMLLREWLDARQLLEEIGGIGYLMEIMQAAPNAANAVHYAGVVKEKSRWRQLISLSNDMLRAAYAPQEDDSSVNAAATLAAKAATVAQSKSGADFRTIAEITSEVYQQAVTKELVLVPSGFDALDAEIGGFGRGEMWLIGARPSMGKSTLSKQMALRIARKGFSVAYFSLEEGEGKIGRNILSAEAYVANNRLRKPQEITFDEFKRLGDAERFMRQENPPLRITGKIRRLTDVRAAAARAVAKHGAQVVIIDYLQRIGTTGKTPYERANEASLGISDLCKDLDVVGIVPVQLSRATVNRDNKRPTMTDLRDSGQIEQDADGIIFLHREDYYRHEGSSNEGEIADRKAELIIDKFRDGERNKTVLLRSNLVYQTFEEWNELD